MAQTGLLTHPRRDLVAAQSRQADVEQNRVRRAVGAGCQCGGTVASDVNIMARRFQQHRQAPGSIHAVIHDQHAATRSGRLNRFDGRRGRCRHSSPQDRQADDELAAFALNAVNVYGPSMQLYEPLHEA